MITRTITVAYRTLVNFLANLLIQAYAWTAMAILFVAAIMVAWQLFNEGTRGFLLFALELVKAHPVLSLVGLSYPLFLSSGSLSMIGRTGVPASSINVIDGDTLSLKMTCSATGELPRLRVRISGYDSPEMTQRHGKEAADFLRKMIKQAGGISLKATNVDNWGRTVAHVRLGIDGKFGDLAQVMIKAGYGHADSESTIIRYLASFQARIAGRGMWEGTFLVRLLGIGVVNPTVHRKVRQVTHPRGRKYGLTTSQRMMLKIGRGLNYHSNRKLKRDLGKIL